MTSEQENEFVRQLTDVQSALRLYVRALMPGDPAAADVAQLANTRIWEKRADFTPGSNFKAWSFAIARFEVLSQRKRQARDARLIFSDGLDEVMADEIASLSEEQDRRQQALKTCLGKLKAGERALLMHRYHEEAPLKAFAEQSGRSLGGLKVTLHRLRASLQACIRKTLSTAQS